MSTVVVVELVLSRVVLLLLLVLLLLVVVGLLDTRLVSLVLAIIRNFTTTSTS